jgi:ATP-binding cassette subfamily B protein
VSLDLPQGKSLGVVGVTGSGKTMLCNLLCRFVDPNNGEISVNGINYRDVELSSLRQSVSYVPQDIFLFSETIERNVALYAPDTPFERVQECCRIAQADDFITAMPEGYETIIGERGVGLSGGQRQRLSIARAILKDSPVMIFDDSSSALDTETEKRLLHALYTDLAHKTKVIVAHKISSVKDCDEIIVLDQGRIVERGTHEELLRLAGRYAEIYTEQLSSNSEVA